MSELEPMNENTQEAKFNFKELSKNCNNKIQKKKKKEFNAKKSGKLTFMRHIQ